MSLGLEKALGVSESSQDAMAVWGRTCALLRRALGDATYASWFQSLEVVEAKEQTFVLRAPSAFIKAWVETHYMEQIERYLCEESGISWSVLLELAHHEKSFGCSGEMNTEMLAPAGAALPISAAAPFSGEGRRGAEAEKHGIELGIGGGEASGGAPGVLEFSGIGDFNSAELNPQFTFENFVVGKPNEFAYAAAQRIAESTEIIYNPFFLYGPVGHGKTHLMHAIAHHLQQNEGRKRRIFYLSAERFMYYFVRALRYKDMMTFKEKFRSVDVLMIDDVQFISGKDATQEEFFHTFNELVDRKRQVIISADKPPTDLDGMQERMKSRLGWGLVADLHPTTYELRLGILHAKAERLGIALPKDVGEFIAQKVSSSVRELEGALTRVHVQSVFLGRPLDVGLVQETLRDLLRSFDKIIDMEDIQKRVAEYYGLRLSDLRSTKRTRLIARPRQVAMFLSKTLTSTSLPMIGKSFGGRDHTTVIHAVQTIQGMLESDPTLREDVETLRRALLNT